MSGILMDEYLAYIYHARSESSDKVEVGAGFAEYVLDAAVSCPIANRERTPDDDRWLKRQSSSGHGKVDDDGKIRQLHLLHLLCARVPVFYSPRHTREESVGAFGRQNPR